MGTLFVLIACIVYGLGLMLIPAALFATLYLMVENYYCKKRFGESLFKNEED